jgi:TPR repeat protein
MIIFYEEGKVVEKNIKLSKLYKQKAYKYALENCDFAISSPGSLRGLQKEYGYECFIAGVGYELDKRNIERAIYYLDEACRLGEADGCSSVASIYDDGEGEIKIDKKRAKLYYEKSCTLKDEFACSTLGRWYQYGEKDIVSKDLTKAKEYYQKSCEFGNKNGCDSVKKIPIEKFCEGLTNNQCYKKCADYYESGEKKNLYIVKRIFKEGCKNNNKNVCFGLGLMFLRGKGVTADHKIALKYFKKSCKLGFGDACSNVAWIYMHGTRVKHNIKEALKYQKRGCY